MSVKKFSQDSMIQDLYELYHMTVAGAIDPKITNAATGSARAIGQQLNIQLKIKNNKLKIKAKNRKWKSKIEINRKIV